MDAREGDQFLHFTARPPSAVTARCLGFFSAGRTSPAAAQEVVVAAGPYLLLCRPDPDTGVLDVLCRTNTYTHVRGLATISTDESTRDLVLVASDAGALVVVEFRPGAGAQPGRFASAVVQTFGRTGLRVSQPGHFAAADPKGRAALLGSLHNSLMVWVLTRDDAGALAAGSPRELADADAFYLDIAGVDVGFENPVFACLKGTLEVDGASGAPRPGRALTFLELDLGLNSLVQHASVPVEATAHALLALPGGDAGVSGVLVASDDTLTYYHPDQDGPMAVQLPRRKAQPLDTPTVVVGMAAHETSSQLFVLAQTHAGDVFKLTFGTEPARGRRWAAGARVAKVDVRFLQHAPPAELHTIFTEGFLLALSAEDDHRLYQFDSLGDDEPVLTSTAAPPEGRAYFAPTVKENLSVADTLTSLGAAHAAAVAANGEPWVSAGSQTGAALRPLAPGITPEELLAAPVPGRPTRVFTARRRAADEHDAFIVLSLAASTLVMAVGDEVTEVEDHGLRADAPTLWAGLWGSQTLLQVHPEGVRGVKPPPAEPPAGQPVEQPAEQEGRAEAAPVGKANGDGAAAAAAAAAPHNWEPPAGVTVVACACNGRQLVLALSDRALVYFEPAADGALRELARAAQRAPVLSLALAPLLPGQARALCVAVGADNQTVRIASLQPSALLEVTALQAAFGRPLGLAFSYTPQTQAAVLHVATDTGIYLASELDAAGADLGAPIKRVLAPFGDNRLALGWQTATGADTVFWLAAARPAVVSANAVGVWEPRALAYAPLAHVARFSSAQAGRALLGLVDGEMRIFQLGADAAQRRAPELARVPLSYRARALAPPARGAAGANPLLYVLGSEAGHHPAPLADGLGFTPNAIAASAALDVVDAATRERVATFQFPKNARGVALATHIDRAGRELLVVSVVTGLVRRLGAPPPPADATAELWVLAYTPGSGVQRLFTTPTPSVAFSLLSFEGRVAAGFASEVALFEVTDRSLLRQTAAALPGFVSVIALAAPRKRCLVAADSKRSAALVVLDSVETRLVPLVDDAVARPLTAVFPLSEDTFVVGDRAGSLTVLRVPADAYALLDDANFGALAAAKPPVLNGLPFKFDVLASLYVDDIPAAFVRTVRPVPLRQGETARDNPAVWWVGARGTVGALARLGNPELYRLLRRLERAAAAARPALTGRRYDAYRGYYAPQRNFVDGDMCEELFAQPRPAQDAAAEELGVSVDELRQTLYEHKHMTIN